MPDGFDSSGQQGQDSADSQGNKTTGYQRLKAQRDAYRAEVGELTNAIKSLAANQERMETALAAAMNKNNPPDSTPGQIPLEKLREAAVSPEFIESNPQGANEAIMQYIDRRLSDTGNTARLREEITNEVTNSVLGVYNGNRRADQTRDMISREFGEDAWSEDNPLYQDANSRFRQLTAEYRSEMGADAKIPSSLTRQAFFEAQVARSQQQGDTSEPPLGDPGPPPEARVESTTTHSGAADSLAASNEALNKGDWRGSIASKMAMMYPED